MSKNKIIKKWVRRDMKERSVLTDINSKWLNKETTNLKLATEELEPLAYLSLENDVSKNHISLIMNENGRVYYSFSNVVYKQLLENNIIDITSISVREVKSKSGYSYLTLDIEGDSDDDIEF